MKITEIKTFVVDAGWRPWVFVKIETDEGVTGCGECSDGKNPWGVVGVVNDLKPLLLGQDPRAFEMRFWDMIRGTRQSPGGIAAKGIAGIELALLDIKARALGISVVELFGGPLREEVRLYWSHCGTTRTAHYRHVRCEPLRTLSDVGALGREVVAKGYTALKTNIIFPGDTPFAYFPGFARGPGTTDQAITPRLLDHIVSIIATFREAVGPHVDINLDLNFNFKPEACRRIARALEPYNLLWLEIDMYDPQSIRDIKESTSTPICTGENLIYMREFIPYFELRAADVFMVDVPWNGFSQAKKIGDLAETYQLNIAPHNYYSHLATFMSASLCGVLPNVRIMEADIDDVPWRDDVTTHAPEVVNGQMKIPTGPGWGTELREEELLRHPWGDKKSMW
jgi:L-alanine-DL-glutamate epimerase-like enolase superfamily enzyme